MKVPIANDCHIAQTSYKKKKMWTPEKPRAADFQPQTDRHWMDTVNWEGTEPKWRKVLKMQSMSVSKMRHQQISKLLGILGTEPSFSRVTFSLHTVFKNPFA